DAAARQAHAEASRRRHRSRLGQARGGARRDGGPEVVEAGAISAAQHRAFRSRACGLCAFHVADSPLSRPARASRDQVDHREGIAERLSVLDAGDGAARRALLPLRAAGRRSGVGRRGAAQMHLHERARRRGVPRDRDLGRAFRALRADTRAQGRRPRARDLAPARLLSPRRDRHAARRRAHRSDVPSHGYARRAPRRREHRGTEDRLRAGRAHGKSRSRVTTRIYGVHSVRALLEQEDARIVRAHVLAEPAADRLAELVAALEARGVEVKRVNRRELDRLTGGAVHQGIVVETSAPAELGLTEFEELVVSRGRDVRLLVLDGVEDPRNLGACLRTADAAAIDAVVVPRTRAARLTPAARKTATGAAERLPILYAPNLVKVLRWLRSAGVRVVGADSEGARPLFDATLVPPLALVLGGEGRGLKPAT